MKFYVVLGVFFMSLLAGCQTPGTKKTETKPEAVAAVAEKQFTGTGTLVIEPIRFKKDIYVREAVKQQCNLDGKLSQFIQQYAAGQYANIITDGSRAPRNADVLKVEIDEVQGGGGGAWSGAKAVRISGVLKKRGRVVGDFKARRYSGGGFFGAYKGTCAIMGRCVKALGRDVAEWLQHPTKRAALGDM